jgi:hypothetical protein
MSGRPCHERQGFFDIGERVFAEEKVPLGYVFSRNVFSCGY